MSSTKLMTLDSEILQIVDADLLKTVVPDSPALEDYASPHEPEIELSDLDDAMKRFRGIPLEPEIDGEMAVSIRESLPLNPAQATKPNVWWWLCAGRFPDVVRARWSRKDGSIGADRMLGRKLHRNGLARLWWGAEMTRETGDAELYARKLFANQDVFEALVGRNLGNHPGTIRVLLDRLSGKPGLLAREAIKRFRHLLSTLVLEVMSEDEIITEIDGCLVQAEEDLSA